MLRKNLSFILVACSLLITLSGRADSKNESGIQVAGATKIRRDRVPRLDKAGEPIKNTNIFQWCQGSVPPGVDLSNAGLTAKDLKDGVSCIAEDFDHNGYLDFILYQNPPKGTYYSRSCLILFFRGKSVTRTQVCPTFYLFQLNDRERRNYPKYRNRAGLIKLAQGDTGEVYFFDPTTGLFEEVEYVYAEGYEGD